MSPRAITGLRKMRKIFALFSHNSNGNFHCPDSSKNSITSLIWGESLQWRYNDRDGVWFVYSTACSGADQRKHESSTALAFVRGIHRWSVNSPHKGPVTRKMFPFYDVIMIELLCPWIFLQNNANGTRRWTISVDTGVGLVPSRQLLL